MAEIRPFAWTRYSPRKVSIEKVVTQPYDKISQEMQARYYALDPHNIVRIILGRSEPADTAERNVYTRAAAALAEWSREGVLVKLGRPAFAVYFQQFTLQGSSTAIVRKGFIGLGRLEDYANKVVFPHEKTLAGPKRDRLELLRHTRTHFEQIFVLYDDPALRIDAALDRVADKQPDIDVLDEYGVRHTLWLVDDPTVLGLMENEMREKTLVIADGHHRYETALAYRDEMRSRGEGAPFEYIPMTFFNVCSPGLAILATHRTVSNLADFHFEKFLQCAGEFFAVRPLTDSAAGELLRAVEDAGRTAPSIGVWPRGAAPVILSLKASADLSSAMSDLSDAERSLDVALLHRLLIERCLGIGEEAVKSGRHLGYFREADAAIREVQKSASLAFLLNPTRMDQLQTLAYAGRSMPQKSTDFYPKVLSGLILASLDSSGS